MTFLVISLGSYMLNQVKEGFVLFCFFTASFSEPSLFQWGPLEGGRTLQVTFQSTFHLTFGDQLLTTVLPLKKSSVTADTTLNYSFVGKAEDLFLARTLKKMFNTC